MGIRIRSHTQMKRRYIILVVAATIATIGMAYLAVMPSSPRGNFPEQFSETETEQIESAIHRERYYRSLRYLKGGELREAWQWLQRSKTQKVWDVGNQRDGGIWLHVGINDGSSPKSLTDRFIMKKDSGKWKIAASDF